MARARPQMHRGQIFKIFNEFFEGEPAYTGRATTWGREVATTNMRALNEDEFETRWHEIHKKDVKVQVIGYAYILNIIEEPVMNIWSSYHVERRSTKVDVLIIRQRFEMKKEENEFTDEKEYCCQEIIFDTKGNKDQAYSLISRCSNNGMAGVTILDEHDPEYKEAQDILAGYIGRGLSNVMEEGEKVL